MTVEDFELLVSLGVFNSALMNDAVYEFKRYEDPSLVYVGINRHEGEDIGLYDTVLRRAEYEATFIGEETQPRIRAEGGIEDTSAVASRQQGRTAAG